MESTKSPGVEKEGSPSQENIGLLESMKLDVESLEDFEDVSIKVPSMKDVTAQFLQFETSEKFEPQSDNQHDFRPTDYEQEESDNLPSNANNLKTDGMTTEKDNSEFSEFPEFSKQLEPKISDSPDIPNDDDLFTRSPKTERADFQPKVSNDEVTDFMLTEQNSDSKSVLYENKLVDIPSNDEVSTESEDLSFIPKKGETSPLIFLDHEKDNSKKILSDASSNDGGDQLHNTQSLSKFSPEPAAGADVEPESLQGDGLHIKDHDKSDLSDNDDFVPEPIPKDYPEIGAIEGKQFLAAIGLDTWFHPDLLNPTLESLVYWRDPKKSGIVFGTILVILLSLTSFSLISVVAYTSLLILAAALGFRIYKNVLQAVQKTSEGHPFKTYALMVLNHPVISAVFLTIKEYLELDLTVNSNRAREISDVVVTYVNKLLTEFRRLFLVEDFIDSIKFGLALWCLTYVGAWFNGLSLLIIAFVGLFTLPKVYENNKTQIDANIDIVKNKINEVTEKIKAVIPMSKKAEEVKDKGE